MTDMKNKAADLILKAGTVYPGRGMEKDLQYVAICGDTIIATGSERIPDHLIDEKTALRDFGSNAFIMPGLHDHHVHLILAGMLDKYLNLFGVSSPDECAKLVAEQAANTPDGAWVLGFGFCPHLWHEQELPTKELLDRYVPDKPVLLLDSELHAAWINSKALSVAGIDSRTENPPHGTIIKDDTGQPTGYILEKAIALISSKAYAFSQEVVEDLVVRYMRIANKRGITSVSDMTPYLGVDLSFFENFLTMAQKKLLTVRINAALDLFLDPTELTRKVVSARACSNGMYDIRFVKQFLDGVPCNYTALMLEDYTTNPGVQGEPLLPLSRLNQAVIDANDMGIPVRLHACGDRAVRVALDSYEYALKARLNLKDGSGENGYEEGFPRNSIEHIEILNPADVSRFRSLGIVASVQPEHLVAGLTTFAENCYPAYLGQVRASHAWCFKTLLEAGAVLACGSDSPVVEGNPFEGIYTGMTRLYPDGTPEGGWFPEECLGIEDLLYGYTQGAAFAEGREDELGTLEPGKLADITIVDRNLLMETPDEIRRAQILLTITGGKIVYHCT